jgi:hypothetical protein
LDAPENCGSLKRIGPENDPLPKVFDPLPLPPKVLFPLPPKVLFPLAPKILFVPPPKLLEKAPNPNVFIDPKPFPNEFLDVSPFPNEFVEDVPAPKEFMLTLPPPIEFEDAEISPIELITPLAKKVLFMVNNPANVLFPDIVCDPVLATTFPASQFTAPLFPRVIEFPL